MDGVVKTCATRCNGVLASFLVAVTSLIAISVARADEPPLPEDRAILVRFLDGVTAQDRIGSGIIQALQGEIIWQARTVPELVAIRVPRGEAAFSEDLLRNNVFVQAAGRAPRAYLAAIPNDPDFPKQWGLQGGNSVTCGCWTACTPNSPVPTFAGKDINVVRAWDITTGGTSKVIAIVDTGVHYTHPDLLANMWTNPGEIPANGIDDDANGIKDDVYGANFGQGIYGCLNTFAPDRPPGDPLERMYGIDVHGTVIASIIGAIGHNSIGMAGVCWTARLMAVRAERDATITDCGGQACDADFGIGVVQGVDYAVAEGAHIINVSWGFEFAPVGLYDVFKAARDAGVLVVACAHNDGVDVDDPVNLARRYPAIYDFDNMIVVAATNPDDTLAGFSNFGKTSVDISAPGTFQWTPSPDLTNSIPSFNYCPAEQCVDGTSFAAPLVAGVCNLL